jgi:hypothetical protein
VNDEDCAACDFNHPDKKCLRTMEWVWRGEHYASNQVTTRHLQLIGKLNNNVHLVGELEGAAGCSCSKVIIKLLLGGILLAEFALQGGVEARVSKEVLRGLNQSCEVIRIIRYCH